MINALHYNDYKQDNKDIAVGGKSINIYIMKFQISIYLVLINC